MGTKGSCLLSVTFFIVASLILLIYFGVTLVHPYRMTSDYSDALCSAVNVTEHGYRHCVCNTGDDDDDCSSVFPCMEITVNIYPPDKASVIHESRLYKYYTSNYNTELCAIKPCDQFPTNNERAVDKFVRDYGNTESNVTYPCLYNPNNPKEVIIEKPYRIAVIMAMFWPSLVIFVCFIIIFVSFCGCKDGGYIGMFRRGRNNYSI